MHGNGCPWTVHPAIRRSFVYVSTPSGYITEANGSIPLFYKEVSGGDYDPAVVEMCRNQTALHWVKPMLTDYLFRARAHNTAAALTIRVTDRFGRVYVSAVPATPSQE